MDHVITNISRDLIMSVHNEIVFISTGKLEGVAVYYAYCFEVIVQLLLSLGIYDMIYHCMMCVVK